MYTLIIRSSYSHCLHILNNFPCDFEMKSFSPSHPELSNMHHDAYELKVTYDSQLGNELVLSASKSEDIRSVYLEKNNVH